MPYLNMQLCHSLRLITPLLLFVSFISPILAQPAHHSLRTSSADATILVLGDSLSAAFHMQPAEGWVALFQARLQQENRQCQVVNASTAGMKVADGLTQLPQLIEQHQPNITMIALGANDGLHGASLVKMQHDLQKMITLASRQQQPVALLAATFPQRLAVGRTFEFQRVYMQLDQQNDSLLLIPNMLHMISNQPSLMLPDGIHPTAIAQPMIVNTVWSSMAALIEFHCPPKSSNIDPQAAEISHANVQMQHTIVNPDEILTEENQDIYRDIENYLDQYEQSSKAQRN